MRWTVIALRLISLAIVLSSLATAQVVLSGNSFTSTTTPKTNYSASIALVVGAGQNTYLQFSFAGLPAGLNGSNISAANLVVYVDAVVTVGTMDVYAVNGPWSASTITYNNAPTLGTKILSAVPVNTAGYLSVNVTSTVQKWLNGTLANNGIALVPTSASSILASIDSINNILTSHPPQLNLVLVAAGPQGPQGPQGVEGQQGPQGPVGPAGQIGLQGIQGAPGPIGPAGANGTGFNFRQAFNNSGTYAVNDVVTYSGSTYVAIAANSGPNNPTPDTNPPAWSLMAQQGATGAAGAVGAIGSQGPAGTQGPAGATGMTGPQGPAGPMPTGAALTSAANTFAATQTINGNMILAGSGNGIQFADGTLQTTAASGSGSGVPSGYMILSTSATSPTGYSSTTYRITTPGNSGWSAVGPINSSLVAGSSVSGCITPTAGVIAPVGTTPVVTVNGKQTGGLPTYNQLQPVLGTGYGVPATMSTAAEAPGVACVNNNVYIIGGADPTSGSGLTTNQIYNVAAGTWTTGSSLPTARAFLGAVAVNGLIYAIGGVPSLSSATVLPTVEIYNPSTDSWSTGVSLPIALAEFGVAVSNGTIYVIGGANATGVSNSVYSFNPATDTSWSTKSTLPAGRAGIGVATTSNGFIYAIGGELGNANLTGETDAYNPTTDSWSTLNYATMPTPVYGEAVLPWTSGATASTQVERLYAYQGTYPCNTLNVLWCLNGFNDSQLTQIFDYSQYSAPGTFYVYLKN